MLSLTLKNLRAHRRRLAGTFLAVFLGVAFLSGTLVMGDTLRSSFDDLFTEVNAGTDVTVRAATRLDLDSDRGLIDASLADEVAAVEGVASAEPVVQGFGQIIGADGDAIGGGGPPQFAASWIGDEDLNPYRLVEGRAPAADDEVVINRGAAEAGDLAIGDRTTIRTPEPVDVTIVGIATFGDQDGLGTTTYAAFTLDAAMRHITGAPDRVTTVVVKAEPGVDQDELVDRVAATLPDGVEAISGTQTTQEMNDDIASDFLDLFTSFLTVFAGIALLVASFSIYNTFSILVAQRTREAALLRAVGADRRQILGSVVTEALLVGLIASALGLAGGVGFAALLRGLFDVAGFPFPDGPVVFEASTAVISMSVGVLVTLLAGLVPAVKASRVRPLAAIRDVSVDRAGASLARLVTGLAVTLTGVGIAALGVSADGDAALPLAGIGSVLTVIGVVVLGPVVARVAVATIGAPLARLRGVSGGLARRNAMRNPRRTASTASALMVGLGVVTLFTVFASSVSASLEDSVTESFGGDLVIGSGPFGDGELSPEMTAGIAQLPEVDSAVGVASGVALVDGESKTISVAEPGALASVLDVDVSRGSFEDVGTDGLAVSTATAEDNGWALGDRLPVTFADGATVELTVDATYENADILGGYLLPRAVWEPHIAQQLERLVLIDLADGVTIPEGRAAVESVADAYGSPDVEDRDEYAATVTGGVDMFLAIVYVLLALAILIAGMGIANTLSLSVYERTRELGLLRAVGQTRNQLRAAVRWESVIVAVFGAIGGIGLGVFLGWVLVKAVATGGSLGVFTVPTAQLLLVLAVGAIAGVLAGVRPARRAARLDVLQAIATE